MSRISYYKTTTPSQSGDCPKLGTKRLPYPLRVDSGQISPYKATTTSESGNCPKSVITRPPHPIKIATVQNQSFQDTPPSQSKYYWKSSLSGPQHPPKVKTVKYQSLCVLQTLQNWKLSKSVLTRPPKVKHCNIVITLMQCNYIRMTCISWYNVILFHCSLSNPSSKSAYCINSLPSVINLKLCLPGDLNECAEVALCQWWISFTRSSSE